MEEKIKQFIISARQNTYASGMKAKIINSGKTYIIKQENLEYHDTYFDQHQYFQGQEVIFENNQPVWSMSYRGAATKEGNPAEIFKILQKFIKKYADIVRFGNEFETDEGEFKYICLAKGDFSEFGGEEKIYQKDKLVHWMKYLGGIIK